MSGVITASLTGERLLALPKGQTVASMLRGSQRSAISPGEEAGIYKLRVRSGERYALRFE
jgi:hypothetical protein